MRRRDDRLARAEGLEFGGGAESGAKSSDWPAEAAIGRPYNLSRRGELDRFAANLGHELQGEVIALFVTRTFDPFHVMKLGLGPLARVEQGGYRIIREGLRLGAAGFVLLHLDGDARLVEADRVAMQQLRRRSEELDCYLFGAFAGLPGQVKGVGLF